MDNHIGIKLKTREYPVIPSGIPPLDEVMFGGFRKDSIIHFYGEPGSGKSTFAMQITVNIMKQGWRALWVDCNGAFSLKRFQSILDDSKLLKQFIHVKPSSFQNQTLIMEQLKYHLDRVGIVVVDPITHYYRGERYREGSQGFFRELIDKQLGVLTGITHLQKIPVIVVNYATLGRQKGKAPLVEKGFERVERYRFQFTNLQTPQEDVERIQRQILIERAPEKYTQHRTFTFYIGQGGIESLCLTKDQKITIRSNNRIKDENRDEK